MLALFTAARAAPLSAQDVDSPSHRTSNIYRFRILGVYDAQSGEPVEGAEVLDPINGKKAVTSKTGMVSLFFLPNGGGVVQVRKVGYAMQTLNVAISAADTAPVNVILSRAQQLAPVVVNESAPPALMSPMLRGFEERRRIGFGHFITDSMFRRDEAETMSDIITANIPGVLMVYGRHGEQYLSSSRAPSLTSPFCFLSVYVDGVKLTGDGSGAPDFSKLRATDYAGAEFYTAATIPPQFNPTGSGCGVLLLWSREQ